MIHLLHRIQDIQVLCFAVIFGLMASKNRKDRAIRLIWYSFLLAGVVATLDLVSLRLPLIVSVGVLHAVLAFRYYTLNLALFHFTRRLRASNRLSLALACVAVLLVPAWTQVHRAHAAEAIMECVLGLQTVLLCLLCLRSGERETYAARAVLATFFGASMVMRFGSVVGLMVHGGPVLALVPGATFLTICTAGYVLPFGLLWMMNARTQRELLQQSLIDPLTELLNRRGLLDAVQKELARFDRSKQDFSVVVLDLDHFKQLNDSFGHTGGDAVLCELAAMLRNEFRESDVIGRTGGEEFVLVLPLTSTADTSLLIERFRRRLAGHTFQLSHGSAKVSASFGFTNSEGRNGLSWSGLLNEADVALYAAKHNGRNCAVLFHPDMERIVSVPADRRDLRELLLTEKTGVATAELEI